MPFTLTSTAIQEGRSIPRRFTCDGEDVSPDLMWSAAPDNTASLALVVDDPDAGDFVHWLVFNMTGSATGGLPEGASAGVDAPPQGINGFGKIGYGGPCPPSATHHYRFTLYALDDMLDLRGTPRGADLVRAMDGHIVGKATLLATYTRA